MSFGEHLEELRTCLWRAIIGFGVAFLISFIPGWTVLQLISAPVEEAIGHFYDQRLMEAEKGLQEGQKTYTNLNREKEEEVSIKATDYFKTLKDMGLEPAKNPSEDEWVKLTMRYQPLRRAIDTSQAQRFVYKRPGLSTLSPMEAFMAYLKVCFVCGLVLGSPWIFVQLWTFIAAGLYSHEKRLVNVYLPFSVILFIAGVLLCQFFVIPKALQGLLWFNSWLNLEPELRFNEWLTFAILLPVLFGISFQLPMLMFFLERLGIMTVDSYKRKWRMACFIIHAFAAIVTPVDIFSMESLALTMCALYGLGILLCWMNPRKKDEDSDITASEELIEV